MSEKRRGAAQRRDLEWLLKELQSLKALAGKHREDWLIRCVNGARREYEKALRRQAKQEEGLPRELRLVSAEESEWEER